MSPGKDYAPCPHCAANNITHRQVCWRCGYTLPYTLGLDGHPRANSDAASRPVSRAEIERLLDQAQTMDTQGNRTAESAQAGESEPNRAADAPTKARAFLWLRRRAARRTGA